MHCCRFHKFYEGKTEAEQMQHGLRGGYCARELNRPEVKKKE